jgi:site-specific recombinase XerD
MRSRSCDRGSGLCRSVSECHCLDDREHLHSLTATSRNANTRKAYGRPILDFFAWCHRHRLTFAAIKPRHVAAYVEILTREKLAPTVKQHLAAIRMCFDWLTSGGNLDVSPASSVRGPKHVVKKGKTTVLTADQARTLPDSIPVRIGPAPEGGEDDARPPSLIGLRDRALIAVMCFSFARVGAALGMKVAD